MDKRYIARNVPLSPEKLEIIEAYRKALEDALGFKVSLSDAVVHAIKCVNDMRTMVTEEPTDDPED